MFLKTAIIKYIGMLMLMWTLSYDGAVTNDVLCIYQNSFIDACYVHSFHRMNMLYRFFGAALHVTERRPVRLRAPFASRILVIELTLSG